MEAEEGVDSLEVCDEEELDGMLSDVEDSDEEELPHADKLMRMSKRIGEKVFCSDILVF